MGGKTGNRLKGCLYVRFQFYCRGLAPRRRGLAPRTPRRRGGAECTPTVRRMFAACSPHVHRMFAACSPHRQDSALYNFCSICYNSDKERKREREKLNKTTQQLSVFIWQEFLSLYCSRNVVVCYPHRQAGALYNFCSICYNSDKERKSEREKERKSERAKLSKSPRSLAGASPPHPRRRGQSTRPP